MDGHKQWRIKLLLAPRAKINHALCIIMHPPCCNWSSPAVAISSSTDATIHDVATGLGLVTIGLHPVATCPSSYSWYVVVVAIGLISLLQLIRTQLQLVLVIATWLSLVCN